jgi:hypothetical protein
LGNRFVLFRQMRVLDKPPALLAAAIARSSSCSKLCDMVSPQKKPGAWPGVDRCSAPITWDFG